MKLKLQAAHSPIAALSLLLTLLLSACGPAAPAELAIEQARLKEPLPGKTVAAGYFELLNPTQAPVALVKVTAEIGSSVEIHRTVQIGDQVSMERVKRLPLPSESSISFAPGGYHLMLFGIDELPEQTPITMHFADGQMLTATFAAEAW